LKDAPTEFGLGAADVGEGFEQVNDQGGEIVGAPIGQGGLREGPDALIRVQLRRVGGEPFQVEAGVPAAQVAEWLPRMGAPVVPEDNDAAP